MVIARCLQRARLLWPSAVSTMYGMYACMLLRSALGLLLALAAAHLAWQAGAVRAPPVGGSSPTSAALGVRRRTARRPVPLADMTCSHPGWHCHGLSNPLLCLSLASNACQQLTLELTAAACRDASLAAECTSSKLAPCAAFHRVSRCPPSFSAGAAYWRPWRSCLPLYACRAARRDL